MQDESGDYGADLRRWLQTSGLTQRALARKAHISESYITDIKNGRKIPDDGIAKNIDGAVGAGGQFLASVQRARRQRAIDQNPVNEPEPLEEDDTDRRQFVGGLAAAAVVAAEVSHRLAQADPSPLALEELEAEVDEIAATYTTVPHTVIEPRILASWRGVEAALAGRTRLAVRPRLTLLAGQLCYYLGRLAFNTNSDREARTFSVLAGQYAEDVGDPLLIGSVAGLRSSIAYYAGHYVKAADIAGRARPVAHPYSRARLAGYEARAHAAAGKPEEARSALAVMQGNMYGGAVLPGSSPFDEATLDMFTAIVLGRLGEGVTAEPRAERAAARFGAEGRFEDHGHALLAWARSLVHRPNPDPAAAAIVGRRVLEGTIAQPTRTVVQAAESIVGDLGRRWASVPEVADVVALTADAHRALPAGSRA